jgi:hypothetical protein
MSEYRHGKTFRAHGQFLRAAAQHDNASPPEEPVWDEYDAMANVADKLHASRDVAEVLGDLADAAQTLAWMAERVDLAGAAAGRFRLLLMHAERLKKMRDDELDALNGGAA